MELVATGTNDNYIRALYRVVPGKRTVFVRVQRNSEKRRIWLPQTFFAITFLRRGPISNRVYEFSDMKIAFSPDYHEDPSKNGYYAMPIANTSSDGGVCLGEAQSDIDGLYETPEELCRDAILCFYGSEFESDFTQIPIDGGKKLILSFTQWDGESSQSDMLDISWELLPRLSFEALVPFCDWKAGQ